MRKNPYQVYDSMTKEALTGRDLEAHILTKAAHKIKECIPNLEKKEGKRALSEALTYNQRIWTVLQTELSDKNNPLPSPVRQDLLSLSLFVDRHTLTVMAFPDPKKIQILVDINLNIASGLRGTVGAS